MRGDLLLYLGITSPTFIIQPNNHNVCNDLLVIATLSNPINLGNPAEHPSQITNQWLTLHR